MKFPITITAEFRGKARNAGEFVNPDGEKITYGDSLKFEYEDNEGVSQNVALAVTALDRAAGPGFDVSKLVKGDVVTIVGNVGGNDRGVYLSPVSVEKADKAALRVAS